MRIMKLLSKTIFYLLTIVIIISISEGAKADMKPYKLNLPKTIGIRTRPDSPRLINSDNIFKYMNGAGELYLAYGFNEIEVYEYSTSDQDSVLVELYYMKSSDDAFGLLSLDWGGEPVELSDSPVKNTVHTIAPSSRALYGAGLLRIWSDTVYARVMAARETPASKDAVLSLGRTIAANHQNPPEPELLNMLCLNIGTDWRLQRDRIGYFRSHLVLNSLYYISHQNILNLDLSTQAVTAPYENFSNTRQSRRIQFLLVKYADFERAQQALETFHNAYLPEHEQNFATGSIIKNPNYFKLEDGWSGYKLHDQYITIVFECPDQESAQIIIQNNKIKKSSL